LNTRFETLLYEEDDGVATVTLNRPEVHNSFDIRMERELRDLWTSLRWHDAVRVVILTGAGEKAFCTGIDRQEAIAEDYLGAVEDLDPIAAGPVRTPFMYNDPGVFINPKQNDMWKPVVAAVNGMACGGALYMLGESDIIIAADHATFFDPHVTYGMVAGFEAVHLLQKLPLGETLRMTLLGAHERMTAARAHQLGLVSEVVPQAQLMERAMWVARTVASAPTYAVQGTVRAVWMAHELARREAMAHVSSFVALGTQFENIVEGQETFRGQQRIDPRLR
jgi:enoyl-CoA hydratase/carnithine racemase